VSTQTAPEVAASAVVAAMERAWQAIRARHREVPEVVVVLGAGSEARRGLFKTLLICGRTLGQRVLRVV
jgi:hypothetical protein